jgi:hypothetical protein
MRTSRNQKEYHQRIETQRIKQTAKKEKINNYRFLLLFSFSVCSLLYQLGFYPLGLFFKAVI